MRSRISDFLASRNRRQIRTFQALVIGATLAGAAGGLVATAASASTSNPQPPMTTPTTGPVTDPLPPPMTTPTTTPTTNPPGTVTNPGTTAPNCVRFHMRLKFVDVRGTSADRHIDYAFENVGASTCSLRGYPKFVLLSSNNRALTESGTKVRHDSVSPVRTVVVKPGKRTFFTLSWAGSSSCSGNTFTFPAFEVYAPKDRIGFERKLGNAVACTGSTKVSAVRPKLHTF